MSKTCNICCEKINKSTRKEIQCMYCPFKSCRTCCETYVLGESTVKCMNSECGKEWTRKFIRESFSASFVNDKLKKHREDVIFDRERALLPATQPYAEAQHKINEIREEKTKIDKAIREMMQKVKVLKRIQFELSIAENALMANPLRPIEEAQQGDKERRQFIKPCPVDECRGFLSTQWKCGLCSTWSCPDCHMVIGAAKDAPHVCDPNNVESAKLIKMETKPCPKCAVPIFKTDGCDQMWCTQCHIAFSWRTGAIEKNIHNPHYYEYLRKTQGSVPRNPLDNPCQEIAVGRDMVRTFQHAFARKFHGQENDTAVCLSKISNMCRNIMHLQEVEIRDFNYELRNRNLRVDYLLKKIDGEKFKTLLQQAEKKHKKNNEVQDVYRTVSTVTGDILIRYLRFIQTSKEFNVDILLELLPLISYANDCLMDIKKTYGCANIKIFDQNMGLVSVPVKKTVAAK